MIEDKAEIIKNNGKVRQIKGRQIYTNSDITMSERETRKIIEKEKDERKTGRKFNSYYQKVFTAVERWD